MAVGIRSRRLGRGQAIAVPLDVLIGKILALGRRRIDWGTLFFIPLRLKIFPSILLLAVFSASSAVVAAASPQASAPVAPLAYDHPADIKKWHTEGLPIGNGRLGAMLFGGVSS